MARATPAGSIGAGKRFMNEALPYVEAVHAIYAGEATGVPHVPCWMVIDQRYRELIDALYSNRNRVAVETEVTFEDGRTGTIQAEMAIRDLVPQAAVPQAAE